MQIGASPFSQLIPGHAHSRPISFAAAFPRGVIDLRPDPLARGLPISRWGNSLAASGMRKLRPASRLHWRALIVCPDLRGSIFVLPAIGSPAGCDLCARELKRLNSNAEFELQLELEPENSMETRPTNSEQTLSRPTRPPLIIIHSTQLNSTQLNSTQLNSTSIGPPRKLFPNQYQSGTNARRRPLARAHRTNRWSPNTKDQSIKVALLRRPEQPAARPRARPPVGRHRRPEPVGEFIQQRASGPAFGKVSLMRQLFVFRVSCRAGRASE